MDQAPPEIVRVDLSPAILQLKTLGIANVMAFDFFTKPSEESMVKALEILRSLKIIDDHGNLTKTGSKINDFPLDPKLTVALLESGTLPANLDKEKFGCVDEMLSLVAMISSEPIFQPMRDGKGLVKTKKKIAAKEGDHLTLLNVYKFYHKVHSRAEKSKFCAEFKLVEKSILNAIHLRETLEKLLYKEGVDIKKSDNDTEGILRCVCTGYFQNAAQRQPDGTYQVISSREIVLLHPTSILNAVHPEWVIFHEILKSGQSGHSYIRNVSEISIDWLTELAPDYYQDKKAEIATQRHRQEAEEERKPPQTIGIGEVPVKKIKPPESVELGVPKFKKPESNRTALLKKAPPKGYFISDMDFDG